MRLLAAVVTGLALGLALAGCGGASGGTGLGCTAARQQPFDPRSALHLLPGAPEPPYVTNPPTSGAHRVGIYPRGVDPDPIPRPIQVGLLEVGFVLVQYQPALGPTAVTALSALTAGSPYVTIAPNSTLPQAVVATAWLYAQRCGDAGTKTVNDLRRFISHRVGHGSQAEIPLSRTIPEGGPTSDPA
jgi:hypothetical protein